MLYNRKLETKIFEFATQQAEDEVINAGGWKENPLDFVEPVKQEVVEVIEEKVLENFQCNRCGFVGKNAMSLKTHKRMLHGEQ